MVWIAKSLKSRPKGSKDEFTMGSIISAIGSLISNLVALTLAGSFLALVAGEVKLAALKKASQGSTKLSGFTQRMTKKRLNLER
jgi:hypothetical protein